jgi:hypothetical protein
MPCDAAFENVALHRKDYRMQGRIDERQAATRIREVREHMTESLIIQLDRSVYGDQPVSREVARFPATWWDAFKDKFFPAWALDRWPVKYEEVRASFEAHYPDFVPSLDDQQVVRVAKLIGHPCATSYDDSEVVDRLRDALHEFMRNRVYPSNPTDAWLGSKEYSALMRWAGENRVLSLKAKGEVRLMGVRIHQSSTPGIFVGEAINQ